MGYAECNVLSLLVMNICRTSLNSVWLNIISTYETHRLGYREAADVQLAITGCERSNFCNR